MSIIKNEITIIMEQIAADKVAMSSLVIKDVLGFLSKLKKQYVCIHKESLKSELRRNIKVMGGIDYSLIDRPYKGKDFWDTIPRVYTITTEFSKTIQYVAKEEEVACMGDWFVDYAIKIIEDNLG